MTAGMDAAYAASGHLTVGRLFDSRQTAGTHVAQTYASCHPDSNGAAVVDPRDGCVLVSAACRRRFHPLKCVLLAHAFLLNHTCLRNEEPQIVSEGGRCTAVS